MKPSVALTSLSLALAVGCSLPATLTNLIPGLHTGATLTTSAVAVAPAPAAPSPGPVATVPGNASRRGPQPTRVAR